MRRAPFKQGDKVVVIVAGDNPQPIDGVIDCVDVAGFSIVPPNQTARQFQWNVLQYWTPAKWKGPFDPNAPADPTNPLDSYCTNCGHKVGLPVRPGKPDAKPELTETDFVICVKCQEWMFGTKDGGLRPATPIERAWMLVHRTKEMVNMTIICAKVERIERHVEN